MGIEFGTADGNVTNNIVYSEILLVYIFDPIFD